jgi:hypothetical protein
MYYGKLETQLQEICKEKSIDTNDLKREWIKDFISKNIKSCKEKYYLKYGNPKDSVLIFGDDGEFYELSDGSRINKNTFDKMYRTDESEIEINPNEFFELTKTKIDIKKNPINYDPVDSKGFLTQSEDIWKNLDGYFKDLDITKIKFTGEKDEVWYEKEKAQSPKDTDYQKSKSKY